MLKLLREIRDLLKSIDEHLTPKTYTVKQPEAALRPNQVTYFRDSLGNGHGFLAGRVLGTDRCSCGHSTPTRKAWNEHVAERVSN